MKVTQVRARGTPVGLLVREMSVTARVGAFSRGGFWMRQARITKEVVTGTVFAVLRPGRPGRGSNASP
jgi:hypothetical protein